MGSIKPVGVLSGAMGRFKPRANNFLNKSYSLTTSSNQKTKDIKVKVCFKGHTLLTPNSQLVYDTM